MKRFKYVWIIDQANEERTLAYYYINPDTNIWGYTYCVPGGGFLPETDLTEAIIVVDVVITAA